MPSLAIALLAALNLNGWEPVADQALGAKVLRPTGWTVEALANDAIVVRAPPPLGGSTTLIPVSGKALDGKRLVDSVVRGLGGTQARDLKMSTGHAALVQYSDPGSPDVWRTALVVAAVEGERGLVAVLAGPSGEFEAARPALAAIVQHFEVSAPRPALSTAVNTVAQRPLVFEPFREPKEQAFTGELPGAWDKDLSVAIVPGEAPYVRASAIGRSPDHLFCFVHYKLASFQEPVEGLTPDAAGFRKYEPGALALERYLFPAVVKKAPADFGAWKITRRGGLKSLFSHESGVRFDGEEVEYEYRFKGELIKGRAYVTTYLLPSKPSPVWFLYGLHGWEAPEGREPEAKQAALRLLGSFKFEGRYAPQADTLWTLARDAALAALSAEEKKAEPAAEASPIPRKRADAALDAVERVASGFAVEEATVGIAGVAAGGRAPLPAFGELEKLR
ncbi:MAG: hypothetical protein ACOX6T_10395 [Myxococcales bacterium]|jgi:hypothetical protein